jgi:acyl-coenzyme A synthetase/AMP-(fatty) acid ligase
VDLAEVEKALQRLPGITEAHVFLPAEGRGLAAALAGPAVPAPRRLVQALQDNLAPWKIPRRWLALPNLPATTRGKPDARAIHRLFP